MLVGWYSSVYVSIHSYRKLCVSEDSKPPEINCKKLIKYLAEMKEGAESSGYGLIHSLILVTVLYRLPWSRKPKPDAAYERLTQDASHNLLL